MAPSPCPAPTGLICDRGLTLGDLIGVLEQFFSRLGLPKLRFKPAYNPYTEPSMEIFSYSEQLKKWMEVRGHGGRQVSNGVRGTMGTGCMFVQGSSSLFQRRHLGDSVHVCHEVVLLLCELFTGTEVQDSSWPWLQWKGITSFVPVAQPAHHLDVPCRACNPWLGAGRQQRHVPPRDAPAHGPARGRQRHRMGPQSRAPHHDPVWHRQHPRPVRPQGMCWGGGIGPVLARLSLTGD